MTTTPTAVQPTQRVRARWTALLTVANIGVWAGFFGPINSLLGQQAAVFAPDSKEALFGLVTGLGALVSLVVNPLAGALSDRTTGRFGPRHPWTAVGTLFGAAGLLVLAGAPNITVMVIAWCGVQTGLNAALASLTAEVPDHVPVRQRGQVGGWIGIAQILGVLAGTVAATEFGGIAAGYVVCAVLTVVTVAPFVLATKDVPLLAEHRPPLRFRALMAGLWISPRAHPDFAWAWITRLLLNLGNVLGTLYMLYFLKDAIHYPDPTTGVLVLTLLYSVTMVITTVVFGMWSDRIGKRKIFVIAAGLVMTVAAVIMATSQNWPSTLVATALTGAGFGVYTSVDFALITEVLPAETDRAKDLGVINIATALPQVLAPILATPVLATLGGYSGLYVLSAAITLLGAVLIVRVRAVR